MDLGWQELVLILLVVIVIFGAGKLPEGGGALGKGIREFRSAAQDLGGEATSPNTQVPAAAPAHVDEL